MYKFVTSTLLAAGTLATSLRLSGGPPPNDKPSIYDKVEAMHWVIDMNDDAIVTITELSKVLLYAEA